MTVQEGKTVAFVVKATVDGFATELAFTSSIDQLLTITKRLRELGATPLITAPIGNGKPKQPRVEPAFDTNGDPMCPKHKKPLREGKFGLYCPAKDESTERGYCDLKFKD